MLPPRARLSVDAKPSDGGERFGRMRIEHATRLHLALVQSVNMVARSQVTVAHARAFLVPADRYYVAARERLGVIEYDMNAALARYHGVVDAIAALDGMAPPLHVDPLTAAGREFELKATQAVALGNLGDVKDRIDTINDEVREHYGGTPAAWPGLQMRDDVREKLPRRAGPIKKKGGAHGDENTVGISSEGAP